MCAERRVNVASMPAVPKQILKYIRMYVRKSTRSQSVQDNDGIYMLFDVVPRQLFATDVRQ